MDLHLDLVGGLAGDMFIAAVLDAFPEYVPRVIEAIAGLDFCPVACSLHEHRDAVLRGRQFRVRQLTPAAARLSFAAAPLSHAHVTWNKVRSQLQSSALPPGIRGHAIGIFRLLADAEARVHGVEPDEVGFHEVGAWDSIADIVGAATLIDAVGAARWTASAAPLGSGRVMTAHGLLPVPAPATARLLMGLRTIDDGVPGERVTPTGAAILRYLCPPPASPSRRVAIDRTLVATGIGFGTRILAGLSNHVRMLCFEPTESGSIDQRIDVLEFEVDDQSGEDLALGLDRLRAHRAVLDVTQCAVFGKKGRMAVHVQVLACQSQPADSVHIADDAHGAHVPDGADRADVAGVADVIDACFRETTTLGVRHQTVRRIGLRRRFATTRVDQQSVRVKLAERPGGVTAKAEADDVAAHAIHARRASLRSQAELAALKSETFTDA